jgi:hypothetical protein
MTKILNILAGAMLIACFGMIAASQAQTISFADAATTLAQDCGADIKKLCKSVNLGNNRIQACLEQHQASASPTCIATLAAVTMSINQRLAAQAAVFKACGSAAATLCRGVKGEAHILQCLLKTTRIDGHKCNQAITDAGWR